MASGSGDRWLPKWVWALLALASLGLLLYGLRAVLTPVFLAFLIAYMLDPVIDRFEARRIPRAVGIAVMLTVVLGALVLFLVLAVPILVRDLRAFLVELPDAVLGWVDRLEPWLAERGVDLPHTLEEALARLDVDASKLADAAPGVGEALRLVLGGTISVAGAIASVLLVPVLAAYLLHDFDFITAGALELTPVRWRPYVVDVAREVDAVLGEFIRGQLIVMMILAVSYSVVFSVLGVRLAILIGLVAGLFSFIPYVGNAIALGLAVLMCLLDGAGWGKLAAVVGSYFAVQLIEGFVITPRVVGDKVGLPAVWVLVALLVGGELFGFLGVLLALPAAAVIKIFVIRFVAHYRQTIFFLDSEPPGLLHVEGLPDDPDIRRAKHGAPPPGP